MLSEEGQGMARKNVDRFPGFPFIIALLAPTNQGGVGPGRLADTVGLGMTDFCSGVFNIVQCQI
jgi:hypothetical protein